MDHAGAVLGPLIGYLLVMFLPLITTRQRRATYTKIFLLASIPALAAVLVVAFFVREADQPKTTPDQQLVGGPVSFSLRGFDGNFKRFLVLIALFTLSNSSDAFLLLRAQSAGFRLPPFRCCGPCCM